ncbi:MAG: 4Fe-4S binding protein [Deferribacterales bacterium]
MKNNNNNYQSKRSLLRKILISIALIIPFIKIDGNSLFRFDIRELIFYLLGYPLPINNFFFILLATLFFTFAFITMTLVYGRIWCGWLCPQSVTIEVTSFIDKVKKGEVGRKFIYILLLLLISFIISMNMVFYFVDPYKFFRDIAGGYIHPVTLGFIIVLTVIIFLDVYLVRFRFCATVCQYSMIQSVLYDNNTLAVYMIPETKDECIKCNACVKVCSTGIDIRQGLNSACINCAKCIDACEKVMSKRGKRSLLGYLYGPDNNKNLKRPTVLIGGMVTLVFLVATIVSAVNLKSYKVELLTNSKFYPRFTEDYAVNGFQLLMENYSTKEKSFKVLVADKHKELNIILDPTDSFISEPKSKKTENVFLKIPKEIAEKNQLIEIEMIIKDEKGNIIKKKVTFRKPFAKKRITK